MRPMYFFDSFFLEITTRIYASMYLFGIQRATFMQMPVVTLRKDQQGARAEEASRFEHKYKHVYTCTFFLLL